MSQHQSDLDLDLDFPNPETSIYQQAHTQVLNRIGSTPNLSAEERTLYILDLVRYSACHLLGLMRVRKGFVGSVSLEHVQVAIESLGEPETWKAEREKWLGFAKENLGVQVIERVIAAEDTEMTERMTIDMVKAGGEGGGTGNAKGKSPAKRRRVGDEEEEKEGGEKTEEAEEVEEDDEDEEDEEAGTISWKEILTGLRIVELEMDSLKMVSPGNFPLLRSSLELVEHRLEHMKEVFAPLVARIHNTLLDEKGVERKLAAMEKGLASNPHDKERGREEASLSFGLFSLEYKSLVTNLTALEKFFLEHGIPAYVSPFYSTEEKLDSMEQMLVSEMEMMFLNERPATSTGIQSRFKPVMEKLAALEKMYIAAMGNASRNQ